MRALLVAFLSGTLFAVGLAVSGMTNPSHVLSFLDVAGSWDPALLFVMLGAIGVYAPVFWLRERRAQRRSGCGTQQNIPRQVDKRLIGGAAVFGLGWGLAGYCPGPALTSMGTGATEAVLFSVAMVTGFWLVRRLDGRFNLSAS